MHTCKVGFSVPRNKKTFSSQPQMGEKKEKWSHYGEHLRRKPPSSSCVPGLPADSSQPITRGFSGLEWLSQGHINFAYSPLPTHSLPTLPLTQCSHSKMALEPLKIESEHHHLQGDGRKGQTRIGRNIRNHLKSATHQHSSGTYHPHHNSLTIVQRSEIWNLPTSDNRKLGCWGSIGPYRTLVQWSMEGAIVCLQVMYLPLFFWF